MVTVKLDKAYSNSKMNLKKVIESMNKLNSVHENINFRFSSSSKGHQFYQGCLKQDEEEDLRIYGRTHKDTIHKFKQIQRRKSQDVFITEKVLTSNNCGAQDSWVENIQRPFSMNRTKTAVSGFRRKVKEQKKPNQRFLTAQNIFFRNQSTNNSCHKRSESTLTNQKQSVILRSKQMNRKSINKFKKGFTKNFENNIQIAKKLHSVTQHTIRAKTAIVDVRDKQNDKRSRKTDTFFKLTENSAQIDNNWLVTPIEREKQGQVFNLINQNLVSKGLNSSKVALHYQSHCRSTQKFSRIFRKYSKNMKVYILCGSNLRLSQFKCKEQTLAREIRELLKTEKIIHLYFVEREEVVHDELVVSVSWNKNLLLNSIEMIKFLFKRFVSLEQESMGKRQQTIQEAQIIFKNSACLPKRFEAFLYSIQSKNIQILDFRQNKREIKNLKCLISDGLRHLELQKMELGGKSTKIQDDGKRKFYFYICSFIVKVFGLCGNANNISTKQQFLSKNYMDLFSAPSFAKKLSNNETLPSTPQRKAGFPEGISSAESADKIFQWLEKKGVKTMANPQDLQLVEFEKKRHDICEVREQTQLSSILLNRRTISRGLSLKI